MNGLALLLVCCCAFAMTICAARDSSSRIGVQRRPSIPSSYPRGSIGQYTAVVQARLRPTSYPPSRIGQYGVPINRLPTLRNNGTHRRRGIGSKADEVCRNLTLADCSAPSQLRKKPFSEGSILLSQPQTLPLKHSTTRRIGLTQ